MSTFRRRLARLALPLSLAFAASASFCEEDNALLTPISDQTPPVVTIIAVDQVVDSVEVQVRATDGIALRTVTIQVNTIDAIGDTVQIATRTFTFTGTVKDTTLTAGFGGLPITVGDPLVIRATAQDANNNVSFAIFSTVVGLQAIDILTPGDSSSLPIGDSVLTGTFLADPAGIVTLTLVGRSIHGDVDLGTHFDVVRYQSKTVNFDPPLTDTLIQRFLVPTDVRTAEEVYFVALAENTAGRILADSNLTFVGGPLVEIVSPVNNQNVLAGTSLDIRVHVSDTDPLVSAGVSGSGVTTFDVPVTFPGPVFDTTFTISQPIPAGANGNLVLVARATNSNNIQGRSSSVTVRVGPVAPADTIRPEVTLVFDNRPRLEVDDSIHVVVTVQDPLSGVQAVGISVMSNNAGVLDTATFRVTYPTPRSGTIIQDFYFLPFNFDPAILPDTVAYELHAFAYDAANPRNCGAAVIAGTQQQLACDSVVVGGAQIVFASGATGARYTPMLVSGQTIASPVRGSVTPDLVVDTTRQLLFVSNFTLNQLDVFDLTTQSFATPIAVGSQPWGMVIENSGDTLIVGNSGGTNLSKVFLDTQREVTTGRIFTPNNSIFVAAEEQTETGVAITVTVFDYSDRPQFVAQGANVGLSPGVLMYSTVPTPSAPDGSIRQFDNESGDVRFFVEYARGSGAVDQKNIQIVNADDVFSSGGLLFICDHDRTVPPPPGPTTCVSTDQVALADSIVQTDQPLWDTKVFFNLLISDVGLRDTTFVAASGDREFIAIGEGATGNQPGRIMMYQASNNSISSVVEVEDLIGNASEPVRGLALNLDGSLGVARGEQAYFFDSDLRLQGVSDDVSAEGMGATFHPAYSNGQVSTDALQISFLGSSDGRIDLIDSFHFCKRGTLFIRDAISGPVRASLPFAGDPAGTVIKVYALTTTGVVVVNVLSTDISAGCQQ